MLVHFRLHLCKGYPDQYYSCKRLRVQWSLNGILTPTPLPPQLLPLATFLPLMATSTSSDPTSDSSSKSLIFHSSKIGPTISSDIADYVTLLSDVYVGSKVDQWSIINGKIWTEAFNREIKVFLGSSGTVIQSGWNQTTWAFTESILCWRLPCRDRVLLLRHKISANT